MSPRTNRRGNAFHHRNIDDKSPNSAAQIVQPALCYFNLGCTRKHCVHAHQSSNGLPGVTTDVTRICSGGVECRDCHCVWSHPSPALKVRKGISHQAWKRQQEKKNWEERQKDGKSHLHDQALRDHIHDSTHHAVAGSSKACQSENHTKYSGSGFADLAAAFGTAEVTSEAMLETRIEAPTSMNFTERYHTLSSPAHTPTQLTPSLKAESDKQFDPLAVCPYNLTCHHAHCSLAHQTIAAPPGIEINVNWECIFGADCNDSRCRASHPSPSLRLRGNFSHRQYRRHMEEQRLREKFGNEYVPPRDRR